MFNSYINGESIHSLIRCAATSFLYEKRFKLDSWLIPPIKLIPDVLKHFSVRKKLVKHVRKRSTSRLSIWLSL